MEPFKMKSRKTIRDTNKAPKIRSVDVTGMKVYPAGGKELHSYFKKGGRYNP
jgi:hypothetical protein